MLSRRPFSAQSDSWALHAEYADKTGSAGRLLNDQHLVGGHIGEFLHGAIGPVNPDNIRTLQRAKTELERLVARLRADLQIT